MRLLLPHQAFALGTEQLPLALDERTLGSKLLCARLELRRGARAPALVAVHDLIPLGEDQGVALARVRERRVASPKSNEACLSLASTLSAFALVSYAIVSSATSSKTLRVLL
jgi:hypothetical protein